MNPKVISNNELCPESLIHSFIHSECSDLGSKYG